MYFVYILQSLRSGRFYVGHTDNLLDRFDRHRNGRSKATKSHGPWWMPYFEIFPSRSDAMKREREIKRKKSATSIRAIIAHALPELDLL